MGSVPVMLICYVMIQKPFHPLVLTMFTKNNNNTTAVVPTSERTNALVHHGVPSSALCER